jgi:predicted Zn-dependent protease
VACRCSILSALCRFCSAIWPGADEREIPLISGHARAAAVNSDRRALARVGGVLVLALSLAGCVTASMPGSSDMMDAQQTFQPADKPITVDNVQTNDRFAELARRQHPKILATYGGEYSDPKLERMVAKVVGNLTTVSGNPGQTYRITILNSPNVNAFAMPGGYLYVTRGLLALANDSAELATVIAHEMGHVTANHGVQRQRMEEEAAVGSQVAKEVLGGTAVAQAAIIRGKLKMAQFSRNQELEADAIGIRASGQAGFDPFAAARFLGSMGAYSNFRTVSGAGDASLDFLASHPNTPQRVDLAQRHARQFGGPGIGSRDRDSYLAGIDGLMFGDTPDEGYVRGNTFLHPRLGITFAVPQGFIIDNNAQAVTAAGPGDTAIRFDGVTLDPNTALTDYLRSGWVTGLDSASVKPTTINGAQAAIGKARADGWNFDVTVVRAGGQVYRLLTAAPASSNNLDAIARTVSGSFRLLSASEKAALKPLRIRVVTVRPGETVASLAARMTGVDRKEGLFRLLNALSPEATVAAGDKIKIVTDQ